MTRRSILITIGAAIGSAVSLWVWLWAQRHIAAGEQPAGVGFGVAHSLFFISLPWSFIPWLANLTTVILTGIDNAAINTPFFYAMPVVAGAGWGWVADRLYARIRRPRAARVSLP